MPTEPLSPPPPALVARPQDGSGSIETAELKKVIEKCGVEVSVAQCNEMIKEADEDQSGTLEFDEFLNLMWRLQSGPSERELRNEMFTVRARGLAESRCGVRLRGEPRR